MTMWGIHNDTIGDELVAGGFISLGWEEMPNLRMLGDDRERMKAELLSRYPGAKPGAIPVWAGILLRFAFTMREGDIVIAPDKATSTLNFGRIVGPYEFDALARRHPHRRPVQWLKTDVPRGLFPQSALHEIGSALTLFRVKRHEQIFKAFLDAPTEDAFLTSPLSHESDPTSITPELNDETSSEAVELPDAEAIEQSTSDFIIRTLLEEVSAREFEFFTADLLIAMGYVARATRASADGGIDVIAHRDALGLEPPLIKVQCKHRAATESRPDVQKLLGTLTSKDEHGLFVTLGTYSREARDVERERQNLRLLDGPDVARLVVTHYPNLPLTWRDRLPLRQVYVVERRDS
ncbi:restriction endonuclease [Dermacoccus nishinomiyaensis]|uniref:Restriction endonuclease n=1 Tax=Dermacoccus nishinomiyaensis TaxID=1274 RepID=A0A075JNU7_9MICO|nr:restriction endonuclease [Dermacoccus nishinomiyaensis]AIF41818.1 restriction endonuclease [Dermacoccus nishinomiyaensis]